MVTYSIWLSVPPEPEKKKPLTALEHPVPSLDAVVKLPKSAAFPVVEIVTKSITSTPDGDTTPPAQIPQTGEATGIKLPYIVTLDQGSKEVLSIRRNYKAEDPLRKK